MIEAESVVTANIVKKLKGNFLKVFLSSTTRRLERFFNNPRFDLYEFYDEIIKEVIKNYKINKKEIHITIEYCYGSEEKINIIFLADRWFDKCRLMKYIEE